jgi:hypothetical protein
MIEKIGLNIEMDNMETHHHAHVHETKKWKEYLFHFIMLFLAVFFGFLAEYMLEHKLEHEREIVLAIAMIEDLKKDSAALEEGIAFSNKKLLAADNLIATLHTPRNTWSDTAFYKNTTQLLTSYPFTAIDGTYQQLKSGGMLRYFEQGIVNQMNANDNQIKKVNYREIIEDKANWELYPYAATVVNYEVNYEMRFNQPITKEMYINLNDKASSNIFINKIMMVKTMRMRSLQEYKTLLQINEVLLKTLQSKYH